MPQPITPQIVYDLTAVSDPSLSPDGRRLAFVQSKVDEWRTENRSQIMMKEMPNGAPTPFTRGNKDTTPRFSPDGLLLAFVRPDSRGKQQLWVIQTSGGEARQLTSVPGGITEPAWSPDSSALVFVSDVDPDLPPEAHDLSKEPRVRVVRRVRYRADTVGWRGDAFRHLFVVDVESGGLRQLTDGEGEDSTPVWSPDGARIAFISDRVENREFVSNEAAFVVPAAGGEPQEWSQGLSTVAAITWSPDSDRLLAVGSDDDEAGAGWQGKLFILEPGLAPRQLTDYSVRPEGGYSPITPPPDLRWTTDGQALFLATASGESFLCEVPIEGGDVRKLAGGNAQFGNVSFDSEARQAVISAISPSSSGDLYLVEIGQGSMKQITAVNQEYFEEHPPALLEKFTLSRNGATVESRLFLPPDFDPSGKYPLILDIHGGPHGVFYDAFNPTQQVLATNGYIVLAVNPRGSATYGIEFMKAVLRDWGGEDYLDIMAAVDEVCSRPYVDSTRLGVTGYSYGGFMSSWIIGHDTRFRAAVVGAPVTNLSSMYGTSDIGIRFGEVQWGGGIFESLDTYLQHSPLTYAPDVQTPVLLLHGEADVRCPIEQSEQYFVALKRLGKDVEFVRFPDCAHSFLRSGHPRMREEYFIRALAWFDRYIGASAASAVQTQPVVADD